MEIPAASARIRKRRKDDSTVFERTGVRRRDLSGSFLTILLARNASAATNSAFYLKTANISGVVNIRGAKVILYFSSTKHCEETVMLSRLALLF